MQDADAGNRDYRADGAPTGARRLRVATTKVERIVAGGRPMEVTFVRFTEPAGGRSHE